MDENKIISLENLNQYSDETSDKIKSYVDTKISEVAHPEYTLVKKATADEGFTASYNLTKNGEVVGATINIPKDYLVKSADIKVVETADTPVEGYVVGDKYIDFVVNTVDDSGNVSHIYLLVTELVDVYKAGDGIVIGADNTITLVIQDGTKTVGGVTAEDYNNFKSAYEDKHTHSNKSVLDEINEKTLNGGEELSGSTGYTVTDSVEYPLVGLKVFGKSTQDGTPSPENPVEIVSVAEPTVTVCGKNLLNPTLETSTQYGVTCTNNGDGTYTLNGTAKNTCFFKILWKTFPAGNYRLTGCPQGGSEKTYLMTVRQSGIWFGRDTGSGLTFRNNSTEKISRDRIEIEVGTGFVCDNLVFKPMLINADLYPDSTYDDFEPYKGNTLPLPYTLNAIPVSSGGNVTIDGQEYIADYVDFGEGKYHKLVDPNKLAPTVSIVDNLDLLLASEEITDISESEMQAYRQLQTYNGITNISNDKGSGLSVQYCTNKAISSCVAPITTGLQKQIDDLKAAILSLGGNV